MPERVGLRFVRQYLRQGAGMLFRQLQHGFQSLREAVSHRMPFRLCAQSIQRQVRDVTPVRPGNVRPVNRQVHVDVDRHVYRHGNVQLSERGDPERNHVPHDIELCGDGNDNRWCFLFRPASPAWLTPGQFMRMQRGCRTRSRRWRWDVQLRSRRVHSSGFLQRGGLSAQSGLTYRIDMHVLLLRGS
jgi:hypothetical protein